MTLAFIIYAVAVLPGIILMSLREFHMLQLNSYNFTTHRRWMAKNYKRYIFALILFVLQLVLYFFMYNFYISSFLHSLSYIAFMLMNLIFIPLNLPKKFKKPLVYTARVKRMMVTFFILVAAMLAVGIFWTNEIENSIYSNGCVIFKQSPLDISLPVILAGSALYLTPILVILSNIINAPIEAAIRQYYINDAKKMLNAMPNLHKIGITGSYGKTSMKFYLSELLNSQYSTLKTPESYNTPMGVVKTVRMQLKPTHEYFVCEMGARRVGEIKELCDIANPHDGIITSVGAQHLETFKSIENVIKTKFELADSIPSGGKIYLNADNEYICKKAKEYKNAVTYGTCEGCDYCASDISVSDRGTEFTVTAPDGKTCRYMTKLLGEHNVQNILGAIAYCHGTGIALEKLVLPVKRIAAVPHRLQLLDTGGNLCYIDDAYNSNPNGCRAALNVLGLFDCCKILVTPGMVELGAKQDELNFEFGTEAANVCDYIVLVGKTQTEPIYNGIMQSGYPADKVFVAGTLNEALDKVRAYKTDKKKIVLLENDLPDNY